MTPYSILIVDDSRMMRTILRQLIEVDNSTLQVAGEAANGEEALEQVRALKPDVITMDVEMPTMDGITAVRHILEEHGESAPPIIMVSSHTSESAHATVQALRAGAVDFVSKKSNVAALDMSRIDNELIPKLQAWAKRHREQPSRQIVQQRSVGQPVTTIPADPQQLLEHEQQGQHQPKANLQCILIGSSTGGPAALPVLLKEMGRPRVPVIIAQHMPATFTNSFAENLSFDLDYPVEEATFNTPLDPQTVYILPGGQDAILARTADRAGFQLRPKQHAGNYHPAANLLFRSSTLVSSSAIGVVLTGMGDDGAEGLADMARRGFPTVVQTPHTAVISGMPDSAIAKSPGSWILDVAHIGRHLAKWMAKHCHGP
ncbi:chemotaxis-specific protein-glutamate methyltransferase CheB [Magnetococcus sp. PR-3]|uniref:chemotaxis-specific protein-glutamate methyltransferase CheB n=1 Tax=Magnetococcus sp. PR-3 TaxID=3120355 RepID=UPI002FCE430F